MVNYCSEMPMWVTLLFCDDNGGGDGWVGSRFLSLVLSVLSFILSWCAWAFVYVNVALTGSVQCPRPYIVWFMAFLLLVRSEDCLFIHCLTLFTRLLDSCHNISSSRLLSLPCLRFLVSCHLTPDLLLAKSTTVTRYCFLLSYHFSPDSFCSPSCLHVLFLTNVHWRF